MNYQTLRKVEGNDRGPSTSQGKQYYLTSCMETIKENVSSMVMNILCQLPIFFLQYRHLTQLHNLWLN